MAVENKYVNSNVASGGRDISAFVDGSGILLAGLAIAEVAAADSDGSVYRLFKNVNPELVIASLLVANDAITGGTDYDIGFYDALERGGAEIDKDVLADGIDLSSAHTRLTALDGLVTVNIADDQKRIYELAGHTYNTKKAGYDIALTANTVGSGAGTVRVFALFIQG